MVWLSHRYALTAGALGVSGTAGSYLASAIICPLLVDAYRGLSKNDKRVWDSKIAHTFHAVVVTALVAVTLIKCDEFFDSEVLQESVLHSTTTLSTCTFAFSLGYFVADTLLMLVLSNVNEMLLHHVAGTVALVGTLVSGQCHFYGLLLLSTEITTPFICLRWLLDKAQRRNSQLYLVNGVCIFIGWVLGRILLFFYLFVHMLEHWSVMATFPAYVQVIAPGVAVALFALNLVWFLKICKGLVRLLSPKPKAVKAD